MQPFQHTKLALFLCGLILTPILNAAEPPNVVIIYGDDVGYGDVGAYGSEMIPTPNIDRLAAEGIRFTDAHCSASTCTPSRFSLLTGVLGFRYNARILPPEAPLVIPTDILTMPKLFKKAGYETVVIGKWHLGIGEKGRPVDWNAEVKPGPLEVGFDYAFLLPSTNDRVPTVYLENHHVVNLDPADALYVGMEREDVDGKGNTQYPDGRETPEAMTYYMNSEGQGHNQSVINGIGRIGYMSGGKAALWDDESISDVLVEKFKAYIASRDNKCNPFFVYFASQDIHVPRAPHPRFQGTTALGYRGDAMVQFDWSVGEIMRCLKEAGLDKNTLVIFSSDNGPVYNDGYEDGTTVYCSAEEVDRGHDGSGIWRGGKYQIYEGGTRVPFIVRWPAGIEPGVSDALITQTDLMGSFADLLQISIADDEALDSRSFLPALLGKDPLGARYIFQESFVNAMRDRHWKFVEPGQPKYFEGRPFIEKTLYNLEADPGETNNLIKEVPDLAAEIEAIMSQIKSGKGMRELSLP